MHYLTKWLNIAAQKSLFIICLAGILNVNAQEISRLTLEQANAFAGKNYPAIKKKDLLSQTASLNIENLQKGFLPQFSLNAQATYQSDVTRINIPIPGIKIPSPGKDQYKVSAEVSQLIYDGGAIKQQNILQQLNETTGQQSVEVELYQLRDRVNQLYLGILYLDAEKSQAELIKQDIQIGIKKVEAQVQNGVSFKSNLNVLKAELLKAEQRSIEIEFSRKGMIQTLELFMNVDLANDVVLEKPVAFKNVADTNITRPELTLYADQTKLLSQQTKLIKARNQPKASLFFQGNYGRPTFNFLSNSFDFFYIGGVRFNWPLSGFYTRKNDNQLVEINKRNVDIQKEIFLLNINAQLKQQQSDIDKLNQLIAGDNEIINLRESVKLAANAQLENGVITANDYLREVNAEDQAKQTLITHQIQLLQAQINYETISGKP